MAYQRSNAKTEQKSNWIQIPDMVGFAVIGNRNRFSLSFEVCEGMRIGINGCRVATGGKGDFISFPSWKGKDGSFHKNAYITLTDDEQAKIIAALG